MNPARTLVLVGPTGAGKSTLAPMLARHFGLALFDVDREIEREAGQSIPTLFEHEGEPGFRTRETAMLHRLLDGGDALLATGAGIVLDAGNRHRLRTHGFVVHLHATPAQQLARLAGDGQRPLLQRPDRERVLEAMAEARDPLYAEVADLVFDTGDFALDGAATALIQRLDTHWHRNGVPA